MLGPHVNSDLHLDDIHQYVPLSTEYGKTAFQSRLTKLHTSHASIKRAQLPLMALHTERKTAESIADHLKSIQSSSSVLNDILQPSDARIRESIQQVLWSPDSVGAGFMNTNSWILRGIVTWKTIVLPGFAILMPLLALVVPFFVLRYVKPTIAVPEYMERLKTVVLSQINIPSVLRSRGGNDRIGYLLESLFIGFTLIMFISGLWNQVLTSFHLRAISNDIDDRGNAVKNVITHCREILEALRALPLRKKHALRHILDSGETAYEGCLPLLSLNGMATYGTLWNDATNLRKLVDWIGEFDVICAISRLDTICFPRVCADVRMDLRDIHHPSVRNCVRNDFVSQGHTLLTGPNRGGKSTYCEAVGLSIVCAQAFGFAWARSMTFSPFASIQTALQPCGRLGFVSTFEAEIEFARDVVKSSAVPAFVMMDEIFHSTNAHDGIEASKVFLRQLYDKQGVISLISTHYRALTTTFESVSSRCMDVNVDDKGRLIYLYRVKDGSSDQSSVFEILAERGLIAAENT